ncbi:uncharacterized protein FOMMEDRAFT_146476 [Fomitiporia mediterranea MF3/22]|uniref:uncharacterized protein n=1 Tax=Fomitiporia mediterranea (strain MF3/22) TaxID=694068 RepID=UPI00044094B1|nr:uncharacterized protein FOMMEDRAFT_146476 [Fomitiporia mediterranea MF3/22]EJD04631.1 hypothetical protein FOMMEDRAFT_146476 [Fomitiporia mediterranea MF3/22]
MSSGIVQTLEHDIYIIQLTKLMSVSSMTLYLYDFLLTHDDEVLFMWKAGFGLGKVVYFSVRYLTLFVMLFINIMLFLPQVSDEVCLSWIRFHWVTGVLIGFLTEIPLVLRIYALYNKNKQILALIVTCLIATALSMLSISACIMRTEGANWITLGAGSDMHMCVPTDVGNLYKVFWIPLLLDEFLLLCLALLKWYQNLTVHGIQAAATNEMVKDSMLYFGTTFSFFLFSHLTWVIGGPLYIELPVGFAITMGGIMSQRLLLNIRKYRWGQDVEESQKSVSSFSGRAHRFAVSEDNIELESMGF